jgi:hypothetical protein
MRTAIGRSLATCAGVAIAVTFPGLISAQVPTRSSEPRLAVPTTETTVAPATVAPAPATAQPETTVTAVTAAPGTVTTVPVQTQTTSSTSYAATDARSYTAGRFGLLVEGGQIALLKSVEGGVPVGEVVTEAGTTKKHLSGVKYEEISAQVGLGSKSLLDWIAQSWQGNATRKSGSIVDMDLYYKSIGEREFKDALITQTTIPTLDAASKEAAYFTVKLAPTSIRQSAGSGTVFKSELASKAWLTSTFRFEMDGLDGTKVVRIESFSVGQPAATDNVGETRDYEKQAGKLVFPNLKISLPQSSASSWSKWFNEFVVMGNNGDDQEKNGGIVLLAPDLKGELGRIKLFNCGIFRLAPDKAATNIDTITRVTVELYCERMELVPSGAAG